jgi:hypothetical protein
VVFGLGSYVHYSAHFFRFLQSQFASSQLCQSEIQYFYRARLALEDIGRLDVAVNDIPVVGSLQSVGDLRRNV